MPQKKSNIDLNNKVERDRYRFGGFRYGLRGPSTRGPNVIIPEEPGLYTFPKKGPYAQY